MRVLIHQAKRVSGIGVDLALGVLLLGILAAVWIAPGTGANAAKTSLAPTTEPDNVTSEALLPIQGPACVTPPSGMISWWPGDGNPDDIQDGNNGTLVNGATFTPGMVDFGFALDGAMSAYVEVPDADNLDVTTAITIDAWINPTVLGGRIVDKITTDGSDGYLLDIFGGKLRLVFGSQEVIGTTTLPPVGFTHVTGTYDFATLKVYVNGILDGTLTADELSIPANNLPLRIGADQTGGNTFSGIIDEVEIFSRALTVEEIDSIVVASSFGKCKDCQLTCPDDIFQSNDIGQCGAVVNYAPMSSLCGTVTCDPPSDSFFIVGTTVITCTSTAGPTCTFNVTVDDIEAPVMNCPDIEVPADPGQCSAVVDYPADIATDNCPGVTFVCNPPSGSTFPVGTTVVDCGANDTCTNSNMCTFEVTVIDTEPPTLTPCPADVSVTTTAACEVVNYTPPSAMDNCESKIICGSAIVMCDPPSGFCFPQGTTTVTCTASDDSPDSPDATCSFTVTVESCAVICPADIMVNNTPDQCSANVTFQATAPQACGALTCVPASGSSFPVGTTTVNCSNPPPGGDCSFTVTVKDTQPPTLTPCPSDISVTTNGTCEVVNYTPPTATDNCGNATVTCDPPSGFCFPTGTTTVTCTASDASTDSPNATCSFTVTVGACAVTCPADIIVNNTPGQCSATVTFEATTPQGCGAVTCLPASGSSFPVGTTTVNCSTLAGKNCSFNVTVKDTQPPTLAPCPSDITVATAGACQVVNYTPPTATDNCGGATVVCNPPSGFCFPVGTTTVTCTASDASPDSPNATCSFTVTVEGCTITCPADITVNNTPGQCGAAVTFAPTAPPACGTVTCVPAAGSVFPVGTTTVNCSTTVGPMCSFKVKVNDTQSPSITCTGPIIKSNDPNQCGAVVTFSLPTASDNCPGVGTPECSPASGSFFPIGTTTVTCTVADSSGNNASCTFPVTVKDTQPPVITCPPGINIAAAASCPLATTSGPINFTVTASDNCPGVTVACKNQNNQVVTSGQTFPVGTTTVTCTAVDASGNTTTCSFKVSVFSGCLQDDSDPSIVVLFNSQTGEYRFCCGGTVFTGTGTVANKGCVVDIQDNPLDRRVLINFDGSVKKGSASLQTPAGTIKCTIQDRDTDDNNCVCQ